MVIIIRLQVGPKCAAAAASKAQQQMPRPGLNPALTLQPLAGYRPPQPSLVNNFTQGAYPGLYSGGNVNPLLLASPYLNQPYRPAVPVASLPVKQAQQVAETAATSSSSSSEASLDSVLTTAKASTPEASNRMRFVALNVTGVKNGNDSERLEFALKKLKEVRGVSVKRQGDGTATVKVWYSDREPLEATSLVEATTKLGFAAEQAETN